MLPTPEWGPANPAHRTGKYARQIDATRRSSSPDTSDSAGIVHDGLTMTAVGNYSEKNQKDVSSLDRRPDNAVDVPSLTQSSDRTPPPRYQPSAAVENAGFEQSDELGDVIAVTSFRSDYWTSAETSFRS
jgi:hypothetical protein